MRCICDPRHIQRRVTIVTASPSSADLVKRLRNLGAMIHLGEKIAWGSDTAIMEESAARIEELEAALRGAADIACRMREIIQPVENDQRTDRERWDALHGQAFGLLGWEVASRTLSEKTAK